MRGELGGVDSSLLGARREQSWCRTTSPQLTVQFVPPQPGSLLPWDISVLVCIGVFPLPLQWHHDQRLWQLNLPWAIAGEDPSCEGAMEQPGLARECSGAALPRQHRWVPGEEGMDEELSGSFVCQ